MYIISPYLEEEEKKKKRRARYLGSVSNVVGFAYYYARHALKKRKWSFECVTLAAC